MVHKCSNPQCDVEFRYASRGRLYSFEVRNPHEPCRDVPRAICEKRPSHATVNFWLCENCCSKFTLKFSIQTGLLLVAKHKAAGAGKKTAATGKKTAGTGKKPGSEPALSSGDREVA